MTYYTVLQPPSLHHPAQFSHAPGRKKTVCRSFWIIPPIWILAPVLPTAVDLLALVQEQELLTETVPEVASGVGVIEWLGNRCCYSCVRPEQRRQ